MVKPTASGGTSRIARRGILAAGVVGTTVGLAACGATSGRFVRLDGRETTLRGFLGQPLMLWFVANGCASCAASIPTVARHLSAFAAARVRVLVLGIYGAFGSIGRPARAQLAPFGRLAAGRRFANHTWSRRLASAGMTSAFDPGGVPDEYFLINRAGRTVYRGATPVSTIRTLLAHLKEIA